MTSVIALIAKTPEPGQVKTRLCPPLEPDQAADVARALLLDTAAQALSSDATVCCAHLGPPGPLLTLLGEQVMLFPQRGTSMAERLAAAQQDLFDLGFSQVMLLGADCPTLGRDYLRSAFQALRDAPVVIGPASDGGYTLLATDRPTPGLFDDVPMGTPRVLDTTLQRACSCDLDVHLLATRMDIDTAEDLRQAHTIGQLDAAPRTVQAARPLLGPATLTHTATT